MVFKVQGEVEHVAAMKLDGAGVFDPSGTGRAMKASVSVPVRHARWWKRLAEQARRQLTGPRPLPNPAVGGTIAPSVERSVGAMGLFFRKTKPSEDLLARGIRGRGTIEHVHVKWSSTEVSMSASSRRMERMLSGEETPIRRKVTMRVEVPGRAPSTVTTKIAVPLLQNGLLVAGTTFEVLVDPDKPDRVAIDWSAPAQRGTMTQMMDDNPMALAAMRAMGLDPATLEQQMAATQQAVQAWMAANPGWQQMVPPGALPPGFRWPPGTPGGPVTPGAPGTAGGPVTPAPQAWLPGTPPIPAGGQVPPERTGSQPPGTTPQGSPWPAPGEGFSWTTGTQPGQGGQWPVSEPLDDGADPEPSGS